MVTVNLIECFERTVYLFLNKLAVTGNNSQLNFIDIKSKAQSVALETSEN